ncbi:MAG: TonB-dependent receptor domain-containing protein [Thiotrichales bacterium]
MKKITRLIIHITPLTLAIGLAQADSVQRLDPVEARAERDDVPIGATLLRRATHPGAAPADASGLLENAPGATVVRNGGLTGIAQLRGLFNERVRIDVDGMTITPACPNHMDPPLHYSAPSELSELLVMPGITSVSAGGDSIAGTIQVRSIDPEFFAAGTPATRGETALGYSGRNNATTASARIEAGNERHVLSLHGALADADDTRIGAGTLAATGYTTRRGALRLDSRTDGGRAVVELGLHRSKDAGTPTLPMDLIIDDADRLRLGYRGEHRAHSVELDAYWHDIEHLMDNFSLRPNPGMRMEAPSTSRDIGLGLKVARPAWGGTLRVGGELHHNTLDVFQRNVATGATQDTFNDAARERIGLFGEWEGSPGSGWTHEIGLRVDRIASETGAIRTHFAPSTADRARFNASDLTASDTHLDATARARYAMSKALDLEFGIARKTRSPSLLERYLWTPLSASAGQADGRTYLGNLTLDPEVAHLVSGGLAFRRAGLELKPALFFNRVSDYIQGNPIARLDANARPVLQYQNLAAELYGLDGSWHWQLAPTWSLGGSLAYVRGKNRDTDDNLYRVAPLQGSLHGEYLHGRWRHRIEVKAASEQDRVAAFNNEQDTAGWTSVNLSTQWQAGAWQVRAGVENLFDRDYHEHLSGINRVSGGDVAPGAPIPAAARFGYLEARYLW